MRIVICRVVRVVGRGRWLSGIGRLTAGQLIDEVFDRLALWIVEYTEGCRRPGVFARGGAGGGSGDGLLLDVGAGREGIKGGDELKHGLARRGRCLLLGRGHLWWRGQLQRGILGDIGLWGRVVLGGRLLEGGGGSGGER